MSFLVDYTVKTQSTPFLISFTFKEYFFFFLLFCLVWLFFNFVSQAMMKASLFNRRHAEGFLKKSRSLTEYLNKYYLNSLTVFIKNCFFSIWIV